MNPRVGKYILDSLSVGMYNHPLILIREYIQNSADSIDEAVKKGLIKKEQARIDVSIDGRERNLSIIDNGTGIAAADAESTLHDIGKSTKKLSENRGFRGIGRLGGLGYCNSLAFATKAINEEIVSISTWDCRKLRQLIKDENRLDTVEVIRAVSEFKREKYEGNASDHFFKVTMQSLSSSRDALLNVPMIKRYLSEVGPVPYNSCKFAFADRIDKEIRRRTKKYETYRIFVNSERIYKPYSDIVLLRGDKKDKIQDIDFVEMSDHNSTLAFGWVAKLGLLGSVSESCQAGGIRIRDGNILVGDKNLLNEFYRENRFNSYLIGELFTIDERLIPNSRRDDFEDNSAREEFYEEFIRKIGLPFSRLIRQNSLERSKQQTREKDGDLLEQAKNIVKAGFLAEGQRRKVIGGLIRLRRKDPTTQDLEELISGVVRSRHYLDKNSRNGKSLYKERLKAISELIYRDYEDKDKAVNIIEKVFSTWV